jgi:hypothetical protein
VPRQRRELVEMILGDCIQNLYENDGSNYEQCAREQRGTGTCPEQAGRTVKLRRRDTSTALASGWARTIWISTFE